MVESKTVDKKIKVAKKVVKKEIKKENVRNTKQDLDIAKLRAEIDKLKKKKVKSGHVSEYNFFIRKQIKSGLTFIRATKEWSKYKALQAKRSRKSSAYNQFIGSQMRLGKTFLQAVALWKLAKAGKLGNKSKTRTITRTVVRTRTIKSKPQIKYRTRKIISKPKIKYRTRTITSKPKIKYRTKYKTRTITSKPKIKYRTRTKTIVRKIKSRPVRRTVTRVVRSAPEFDLSSLKEILASSTSSRSMSKTELREVMNPDNEEIAFKIVQTYFKEIARLGFKRQLTLDEIINAYFYALARVKRQNIEMSEVESAVEEAGMKK